MALDTYYLLNTNSTDMSDGADFTKQLSQSTDTPTAISVGLNANETAESYGYTEADDPGLTQWATGDWTIYVDCSTSDNKVYLRVRVSRVNSSGTLQESSSYTAQQQFHPVGLKTFSLTNVSWAGPILAGDRIRIDYEFENQDTMNGATVALDSTDSYVSTPLVPDSTFTWLQMEQDQQLQPPEPVAVPYQ